MIVKSCFCFLFFNDILIVNKLENIQNFFFGLKQENYFKIFFSHNFSSHYLQKTPENMRK